MRTITLHTTIATCLLTLAAAEDHTVAEKAFKKETTLQAAFLPTKTQPIILKPEVWTSFKVTSLLPQGARVKKGDTIIGIDTKPLDKQIAEAEKYMATRELNLAQAQHELAQLEKSTPRSLEAYARSEKRASQYYEWYSTTGHPHEIEATKLSVKRSEQSLAYQLEELKQLEKMYSEDNKTEETEEIILTRTRNSVERAKFALKRAKADAAFALAHTIPDKLEDARLSLENAQIANASAKEKLPRELKLKQLAAAKAKTDHIKAIENLAKLKADRAQMNITAVADGVVYYGSIKDGRWSTTSAAKVLKVGAVLPPHLTLATVIPNSSPLELSAFAAENQLPLLAKDAKGQATTHLDRYRQIPTSITSIASHPGISGSYRVTLSANIPNGMSIVPGMKATVKVTSIDLPKAIVIPTEYISTDSAGKHSVKVKLADGKTKNQTIEIGQSNTKQAVVTKGISQGQVIVK